MCWKASRFFTCLLLLNLWLCASKPLEKNNKDEKNDWISQVLDLDDENDWVTQVFDLNLKTLASLRPYLFPYRQSGPTNETASRRSRQMIGKASPNSRRSKSRQLNETMLPFSGRRFDPWGGKWLERLKPYPRIQFWQCLTLRTFIWNFSPKLEDIHEYFTN